MNYEAAIFYATQRMREIGKKPDQYHFEPVRIAATTLNEATGGYFEIKAYNEIYILVNPQNYYGLQILADNSGFDSDIVIQSGAPEFTGMIRFIKKGASDWNFYIVGLDGKPLRPIPVEFLRVVIY